MKIAARWFVGSVVVSVALLLTMTVGVPVMPGPGEQVRWDMVTAADSGQLAGFGTLVAPASRGRIGDPAALNKAKGQGHGSRPNILFFIMDDVGIDQMQIFGYGGATPPQTPNIDAIANAGVKFTNVWATPECSPSRATFFTGRYPLRTGVTLAIVDNHLPQTFVSPYETTTPRVLATVGYTSAMVGKYHLGGPNNDPAGDCAPSTRGWDFFSGNMEAGPPSIDTTGGGVAAEGTFGCGYNQTQEGGACYVEDEGGITCEEPAADSTSPSRTCLQSGGIFTAEKVCQSPAPPLDFTTDNAYYVWTKTNNEGALPPLATASQCPGATTTSREYMTSVQTSDGVSWWQGQTGPRMLTVSYNAIHTPFQKPPTSLVADPLDLPLSCEDQPDIRLIANRMLEAMDVEIGRLLEDIGLATLDAERKQIVQLHLGNTMLVIIGDNGSFGPTVKPPFDPQRAKITVYQTGVWVPLIVAGPLVKDPGRSVDHLVNGVDLFQLFGEIAGVDVRRVVPPSHQLDSKPLLPYLTNPHRGGIRAFNFNQRAVGTFQTPTNPATRSWPCILSTTCSDVQFSSEAFCQDNGGVWYGPPPGGDASQALATSCCQAIATLPEPQRSLAEILPVAQFTVRDKTFKLVQNDSLDCACPLGTSSEACPVPDGPSPFPWAEFATKTTFEFYDLTKIPVVNPAGLDRATDNLLRNCEAADPADCLRPPLKPIFTKLQRELVSIQNSVIPCPGDGNLDLQVNDEDIQGWQAFMGLGPSRFDFNLDAQTDEADLQIIEQHLGTKCLKKAKGL